MYTYLECDIKALDITPLSDIPYLLRTIQQYRYEILSASNHKQINVPFISGTNNTQGWAIVQCIPVCPNNGCLFSSHAQNELADRKSC